MYAGTHFTDPGRMESWVNFSGKEGHPNIQPSTRPEIEPGTSGLGGRDLNHCANPSAICMQWYIVWPGLLLRTIAYAYQVWRLKNISTQILEQLSSVDSSLTLNIRTRAKAKNVFLIYTQNDTTTSSSTSFFFTCLKNCFEPLRAAHA